MHTRLRRLYLSLLFVVDACQNIMNSFDSLVMAELRAKARLSVTDVNLFAGMQNNDGEQERKRAGKEKENWYALEGELLTRLHISENGSPCAIHSAVVTRWILVYSY